MNSHVTQVLLVVVMCLFSKTVFAQDDYSIEGVRAALFGRPELNDKDHIKLKQGFDVKIGTENASANPYFDSDSTSVAIEGRFERIIPQKRALHFREAHIGVKRESKSSDDAIWTNWSDEGNRDSVYAGGEFRKLFLSSDDIVAGYVGAGAGFDLSVGIGGEKGDSELVVGPGFGGPPGGEGSIRLKMPSNTHVRASLDAEAGVVIASYDRTRFLTLGACLEGIVQHNFGSDDTQVIPVAGVKARAAFAFDDRRANEGAIYCEAKFGQSLSNEMPGHMISVRTGAYKGPFDIGLEVYHDELDPNGDTSTGAKLSIGGSIGR